MYFRMSLRPEYELPHDPVIEWYKKDVDRTLLREHLKLEPQQRLEKLVALHAVTRGVAFESPVSMTPDLIGLHREALAELEALLEERDHSRLMTSS
jgi:hypothetical protein